MVYIGWTIGLNIQNSRSAYIEVLPLECPAAVLQVRGGQAPDAQPGPFVKEGPAPSGVEYVCLSESEILGVV